MTVHGYKVSSDQIYHIEKRMRGPSFCAAELEVVAIECGIPNWIGRDNVSGRVADRLIQKHRKNGNISQIRHAVWRWGVI
jgi:hypothetical protein